MGAWYTDAIPHRPRQRPTRGARPVRGSACARAPDKIAHALAAARRSSSQRGQIKVRRSVKQAQRESLRGDVVLLASGRYLPGISGGEALLPDTKVRARYRRRHLHSTSSLGWARSHTTKSTSRPSTSRKYRRAPYAPFHILLNSTHWPDGTPPGSRKRGRSPAPSPIEVVVLALLLHTRILAAPKGGTRKMACSRSRIAAVFACLWLTCKSRAGN